jgi:hypothetical protein
MNAQIKYRRPYVYKKQRDFIDDPHRYTFVEASTKSGKAQPLDAIIKTPSGEKQMGQMRIGQSVFTPYGQSKVTEIHPQGMKDVYKVTFSDKSSTECTLDHLWEIDENRKDYRRGLYYRDKEGIPRTKRKDCKGLRRVVSTEYLMGLSVKRLTRLFIHTTEPVQYKYRAVPMDPYLLGLLIGDGGMTNDSIIITSADSEIIDSVKQSLNEFYELKHLSRYDYKFKILKPYQFIPDQLRFGKILKDLKLKGKGSLTKFIPDIYKYNTTDIRWSILQGIMDTDGWVNKKCQPEFASSSMRLANDVAELIESLGGSTGITPKKTKCNPSYRVRITVQDGSKLFRLLRKKNACTPKKKPLKRTFRTIEYVGQKECQCIKIQDERGLYLTDRFIITHNTVGCIIWIFEEALKGKRGDNCYWVAPVYTQSKIAYERLKRYLGKKQSIFTANESQLYIRLINGVTIWFKSGDKPDSLYGDDVIAVVIDEASRCKEEVWTAIRSTITQTKGRVKVIGNVKGKQNWFFKKSRLAEGGTKKNMSYHKLTAMDAVDGGVFDMEELEDAKESLAEEIFQELYFAEAFDDRGKPFVWAFSEEKNVIPSFNPDKNLPICLSFDFNVDPITCTVHQHATDWEWIITFNEFRIKNSNIYDLCDTIKGSSVWDPNGDYEVTGDATGKNRIAMVPDNLNYFKIIQKELDIPIKNFHLMDSNPSIKNSRVLTNSLYARHPNCKVTANCKWTINDLLNVQSTDKGGIDKSDSELTHLIDTVRYYHWVYFRTFIKYYDLNGDDEKTEAFEEED